MEGSRGGPVVVVGAGIVGCAIAVHLADQGVRPVVVDPDRPAGGRRPCRAGRPRATFGLSDPRARLAPFRPGRFAERASKVLLEVESVFRERPRQRPSL
jgi:glycine/D-amino acid oxidase-like deaminating enzyme